MPLVGFTYIQTPVNLLLEVHFTKYIAETSARTTQYQPYGNAENKATCIQINILARY